MEDASTIRTLAADRHDTFLVHGFAGPFAILLWPVVLQFIAINVKSWKHLLRSSPTLFYSGAILSATSFLLAFRPSPQTEKRLSGDSIASFAFRRSF